VFAALILAPRAKLFLFSTVRTPKVEVLRQSFAMYGSDLEIIGFDDLVNGDWTDALKGPLMFLLYLP
jgi:hypothetical protein